MRHELRSKREKLGSLADSIASDIVSLTATKSYGKAPRCQGGSKLASLAATLADGVGMEFFGFGFAARGTRSFWRWRSSYNQPSVAGAEQGKEAPCRV